MTVACQHRCQATLLPGYQHCGPCSRVPLSPSAVIPVAVHGYYDFPGPRRLSGIRLLGLYHPQTCVHGPAPSAWFPATQGAFDPQGALACQGRLPNARQGAVAGIQVSAFLALAAVQLQSRAVLACSFSGQWGPPSSPTPGGELPLAAALGLLKGPPLQVWKCREWYMRTYAYR